MPFQQCCRELAASLAVACFLQASPAVAGGGGGPGETLWRIHHGSDITYQIGDSEGGSWEQPLEGPTHTPGSGFSEVGTFRVEHGVTESKLTLLLCRPRATGNEECSERCVAEFTKISGNEPWSTTNSDACFWLYVSLKHIIEEGVHVEMVTVAPTAYDSEWELKGSQTDGIWATVVDDPPVGGVFGPLGEEHGWLAGDTFQLGSDGTLPGYFYRPAGTVSTFRLLFSRSMDGLRNPTSPCEVTFTRASTEHSQHDPWSVTKRDGHSPCFSLHVSLEHIRRQQGVHLERVTVTTPAAYDSEWELMPELSFIQNDPIVVTMVEDPIGGWFYHHGEERTWPAGETLLVNDTASPGYFYRFWDAAVSTFKLSFSCSKDSLRNFTGTCEVTLTQTIKDEPWTITGPDSACRMTVRLNRLHSDSGKPIERLTVAAANGSRSYLDPAINRHNDTEDEPQTFLEYSESTRERTTSVVKKRARIETLLPTDHTMR